MRIVFDPEQMVRTSGLMTEAAEDYGSSASRLVTGDRPPMPPDIAMRIDAGLSAASASLEDTALRLEGEALMLRARASLVAGDAGALAMVALGGLAAAAGGTGSDR